MYKPSGLTDTFVLVCTHCGSEREVTEATFSMMKKDMGELEQDEKGRYKRQCAKCKPGGINYKGKIKTKPKKQSGGRLNEHLRNVMQQMEAERKENGERTGNERI